MWDFESDQNVVEISGWFTYILMWLWFFGFFGCECNQIFHYFAFHVPHDAIGPCRIKVNKSKERISYSSTYSSKLVEPYMQRNDLTKTNVTTIATLKIQ